MQNGRQRSRAAWLTIAAACLLAGACGAMAQTPATPLPPTGMQAPATAQTLPAAQAPAANAHPPVVNPQTDAHTAARAASQGKVSAAVAPEVGVKPPQGTLVDQAIAVVNGDLVLESDVNEEQRFQAFQAIPSPSGRYSRDQAVERLIDRTLILQQARLQPGTAITDEEVVAQLSELRRTIPACKQYNCNTDAGWKQFVEAQGLTLPELIDRWRLRMEILRFIEVRFRAGIRISDAQIKDYYDKTLLPEYTRQSVKAPGLDTISDRIQEVLLQQQVTALLSDWLKSLKVQGSVRVMRPGEVEP